VDWKEAVEGGAGGHVIVSDDHEYQASRIEVIDLNSGQIVASIVVDQKLTTVNSSFVGTVVLDEVGVPTFHAWVTHLNCR
jgi:hypothetical protein